MTFISEASGALGLGDENAQNLKLLDSCRQIALPFIGAGLSAGFGFPSWHGLVTGLAAQAGLLSTVKPLLAANKFEEAAEAVAIALPNRFDDTLRDTFDTKDLSRPLKGSISHLPAISNGLVLTTNFDTALELAFEDASRPFSQVFSGAQIREASRAVQLHEHCLLKLHGDYRNSKTRILTLSEYVREYGNPNPGEFDPSYDLPSILSQALTARPILFLGCSLKTDRTISVITKLAKQYPGVIHFAVLSDAERTPNRLQQLDRWNIRPLFFPAGRYDRLELFLSCLAKHSTLSIKGSGPRKSPLPPKIRINGYKLFYFRRMQKMGTGMLASKSGVSEKVIVDSERVGSTKAPLGIRWFRTCERSVVSALENVLGCHGELEAGQRDDFLTEYMLYYKMYRGTKTILSHDEEQLLLELFETRAVVFDFDGTLTTRAEEETTWEKMWVKAGYTIEDCAQLHNRYSRGAFSHQAWCDLTRDRFRARGFSRQYLADIAGTTKLVDGVEGVLSELRKKNIKLYVVSGSVKQIIRLVFGDAIDMFEDIQANDMLFDRTGILSEIRGTRFDFEGKATYIKRLISDNGYAPQDILFVGNSCNDVFASQSGARTLCVNPKMVDAYNKLHWTYCIRKMDHFSQILKYARL